MERIDVYPSHLYQGFKLRPGLPYPFGATAVPGGVNFSIYSAHADYCVLVLFEKGAPQPYAEIPFRGLFQQPGSDEEIWGDFRVGNVFSMTVFDLDYENVEYGFRMDGPYPRAERGEPPPPPDPPDNEREVHAEGSGFDQLQKVLDELKQNHPDIGNFKLTVKL